MKMDIIRFAGGILLIALICQVIRRYLPEYAMVVVLGASVILLPIVFSGVLPIFAQVEELFELTGLPDSYGAVLVKCLGICLITQLASEACRDVGEQALAGKIELAAKVSMVLLALPLFSAVLSVVASLTDG